LFEPCTAVVTVIVYVVDGSSEAEGVIVTTLVPASYPTLAAVAAPPDVSVIVEELIVPDFIGLLNVMVGDTLTATPAVPLDGDTALTAGGVTSAAEIVVNDAVNGMSALPTASVIPDVAAIV
jgi:hypothetical protein